MKPKKPKARDLNVPEMYKLKRGKHVDKKKKQDKERCRKNDIDSKSS